MAAAEPEVVHTGNTPEKIAEYKIIYDYSLVGQPFQKEAEKWFGYHTRPDFSIRSEYHIWRKWNDPRVGCGKGMSYMVQLGKCPITVKATGELAISPTVLKQRFYKKEEKKVEEMFEGFRKVFADEMKPVVDEEAGVDVEPVVKAGDSVPPPEDEWSEDSHKSWSDKGEWSTQDEEEDEEVSVLEMAVAMAALTNKEKEKEKKS